MQVLRRILKKEEQGPEVFVWLLNLVGGIGFDWLHYCLCVFFSAREGDV